MEGYEDALTDYDRAIRLDPNSAATFYNRALALDRAGRSDEASRDLDTVHRLDPDFDTTRFDEDQERHSYGD